MNDFDELKNLMPLYLQSKGIQTGRKFRCFNPEHPDKHPSMALNFSTSQVHCFSCGATYDIFDLVGIEYGLTDKRAQLEKVRELYGGGTVEPVQRTAARGENLTLVKEARYEYRTIDGKPAYTKIRKDFVDDAGQASKSMFIQWALPPALRKGIVTLYGDFRQYGPGDKVYIVEGEKCVDACRERGLLAVTAGGAQSWRAEYAQFFTGSNVVILADNDEPGKRCANGIYKDLRCVAESVIAIAPSEKDKGDIFDFFEDGKTLEDLRRLEESARQSRVAVPAQEQETEEEPDELRRFHHLNASGRPIGANHYAIYEHLTESVPMFFYGGLPYIYDGGCYFEDVGGKRLKELIRGCLYKDFVKARTVNAIYDLFEMSKELDRTREDLYNYPPSWVNFEDCTLDVATMQEVEHSPEWLCINRTPGRWSDIKEASQGDDFSRFFEYAVPDPDDRKMLLQYFGLCLTADVRFQKFLLIAGIGGTGKSTLINLVEKMAGAKNASHVSLEAFSERFAVSGLTGKTINTCADISANVIRDCAMLKKIVGADEVTAERKGKDAYELQFRCKMLFSTNSVPVFENEESGGLQRRVIICRMDKQPEEADTKLNEKLEAELPYFTKQCVEALHEAYRAGHLYESPKSKREVLLMMAQSDPVGAWITERCKAGGRTNRTKLYENYKTWCAGEELEPYSKQRFFKTVRDKGYTEFYNRDINLSLYAIPKNEKPDRDRNRDTDRDSIPEGWEIIPRTAENPR